jgi:hypothetical protein
MPHRNQRYRGVGALAGKGGRRGWGAVGRAVRAAGARIGSDGRARQRAAVRPVHEGLEDLLRRAGARLACVAARLGEPVTAGGSELSSTTTTVLATVAAVLAVLALYASQLRVVAGSL